MRMLRSPKLRTNAAIAFLTFLVVTGATLYGAVPTSLPDPAPASAPPTEFSSGRALEHVQAIAQEPHPMGSPENAAARDYLLEELSVLGLEPEVQRATAVTCCSHEGAADAGMPENVLARLEGRATGSKAFLVAAHYDSVSTTPGANDDGAGVAAMLESLRALKAGPPLKNDVIFLFTDGEEPGLLGAQAFVEGHPWAEDVGAVLNLEAPGNTGAARMFETSDDNGWIIRHFAKATPYPFGTSGDAAAYKLSGSDTDLSVFMDAGWAGMNVAYVDGIATHYHTGLDTVEELDERSLQHLGSYALALTRHFGNVSLDHTKAPDEVYFNLLGSVIHYPEGWAIPLMAFLVLLFVGVVALGFRRGQLSLGGIVLGFLALLGSMIVAALGVYLVWAMIRILHPHPNNIFYALNADTEKAIWASYDEAPDAWTAQFLGADAQKGPVTDYIDASEPLLHSDAPPVSLEAPDVDLLDDGTRGGVRTLRVRITPPPRANLLALTVDAEERVVGAALDGERVPDDTTENGGSSAWTLDYTSPPPEGVELTLEVEGAQPLTLTARAATPGLPTIPGESYQDRPPDTMPQDHQGEDMTWVSESFAFAVRAERVSKPRVRPSAPSRKPRG